MKRLSALILILVFSTRAYSWWSVGAGDVLPSTHNRITTRAVELLRGTNDYPDIDRFGDTIIGATSGFADDAIAHGKDPADSSTDNAGKFNGGDYDRWWKEAQEAYGNSEYTGDLKAYYRIGSMAHLVEDHAVPAHAANIYHGKTLPVLGFPTNPDDLEYWADSYGRGPGPNVTAEYFVKDPTVYYYKKENAAGSILKNTQIKLPSWTWPGTILDFQFIFNRDYWKTRQYWYKNESPQYLYTGQAFGGFNGNLSNPTGAGGWGYYGGSGGTDFFAYDNAGLLPISDASEIVQEQLDMAASYTAGMLMAVSRSLPPVIKSPTLNDVSGTAVATVNPGQANTIAFTLMDNRTQKVYVTFHVDSAEGARIISKDPIEVILDPDGANLPWEKAYGVSWNGLLATGTPVLPLPEGGPHTLFAVVTDDETEGNSATYPIGSFTVTQAPSITVTTPLSIPYERFSGVSLSTPASINPVLFPGPVTVYMWQGTSPVTKLTVKNPAGAVTVVDYQAPDGVRTYVINTPLDGTYELTVLDEAGNRTFAPFSLGSIGLAADLEQSRMTGYGKLGASLEFGFEDFYPLAKAELFGSTGTLLRADALAGLSGGQTYSFPDLFDTEGFTRDFTVDPATAGYILKLSDEKGHTLEHSFGLTAGSEWFSGPPGGTIDLSSGTGFLPGVLGRVKPWVPELGVVPDTAVTVTGPVVTTQNIGSYTMSLVTGDTPDFAGIPEQTLLTRGYSYSVWNASYTVPRNCVMQWGAELVDRCREGTLSGRECDSGLLCHNDALAPPLALKRYIRLKNTVQREQMDGVFRFLCSTPAPGGYDCLGGNHPRLMEFDLGIEGWGVAYSGGAILSGGLAAWVPVGDNVTVKLSDWLSLTFEHVTRTGYVRASIGSLPSLPGVLPLRTLRIQAGGTVYTGNISVTVKYNPADITEEQLSFMEALKINDAASRDFKRLSVSKTGQMAVFTTRDLGDFMLEVPSYPAPYQYASADLIGTTPKIDWLVGVPTSVTPVAPGSQAERDFFDLLANRGLAPAGDAYVIGPTGQKFEIAAAIKMVYDKTAIAAKKFHENSLGIYQVSEDGSYLARLGNMVLNTAKGELSAEVSELHSIFVIAGSTEPAPPAPLYPDVTLPVSHLAFGIPAYENGGLVMISSASPVFVDAYDPQLPHTITAGVSTTYYLVDTAPESCTEEPPLTGPPGTCQNPIYTAPFTLTAGTHTVWYGSDDKAGNKETIKNKTLYVDADAPLVTVSAAGQAVVSGVTAHITEADPVTLTATDPALSGPVSGVGMTVFDVSTTPCTGFMDYPQRPGDCRKILYTGPFHLPAGAHTVYYSAMDNVGNAAAVKNVDIGVRAESLAQRESARRAADFFKRVDQALREEHIKEVNAFLLLGS